MSTILFDSTAYPHILDGVVDHASPEVLIALRATCRSVRQRADLVLSRHIVLRDSKLVPFTGTTKPVSWWRRLLGRWAPAPMAWTLDSGQARAVDLAGPVADMQLHMSLHLVPRTRVTHLRFVPSASAEWADEYAVAVAASLLRPVCAVVFCAPRNPNPWALHRAFDTTYNLEHCLQHLGGVAGPSLVIMPLPPRLVLNGALSVGGRFLRLQLLHVLAIDDVVVILHPAAGRLDAFAVCSHDRYCTNCHVLGTVSKALREKRGRKVVLVGIEQIEDELWPTYLGPKQSPRLIEEELGRPPENEPEDEPEVVEEGGGPKGDSTPTGARLGARLGELLALAWDWPQDAIDDVLARLEFYSTTEYRNVVGEEQWRVEAEQ